MNVLIEQNNVRPQNFDLEEDEDIQGFPITEIEKLNNFENDLKNFIFKNKMVSFKIKTGIYK